jgi:hypothetical protein
MGLFSFLQREKNIKHSEPVVLFDITSGSVGASLVEFSPDGVPVMRDVVRESFPYSNDEYSRPHMQLMFKALEHVAAVLHSRNHVSPKHVYCFLSSPWYFGSSISVSKKGDIPFEVNKGMVVDMLADKIRDFGVHAKNNYFGGEEISTLEKKTIQARLNGFPVEKIKKTTVKELDLVFYISSTSKHLIKEIENRIHRSYNREVKFASFMFSSFIVSRDILAGENDYLLVDISGNITEASLVRHDILLETDTFPYGTHTFIQKIAEELSMDIEHARSLFSMYKHDVLEPVTKKKVQNAIRTSMKSWIQSMQNLMSELTDRHILPRKIILASSTESAQVFGHLFKAPELTSLLTTAPEFDVIILDIEHMKDFVDVSEVESDTNLTMQAVFIDHITL